MSIDVSCHDCDMSYRLPDRYAGKRCRCRECGSRIRVPGSKAEGKPKKKGKPARAGAVGRTAQRTTRRLNSQEQDILNDRRALRTSDHGDAVSESMHQLSPMTLSGTLDLESSLPSAPPSSPPRSRRTFKAKAKAKGPAGPSKARRRAKADLGKGKARAKDAKPGAEAKAEKPAATAKKAKAKGKAKTEKTPSAGKAKTEKTATAEKAKPEKAKAKTEKTPRVRGKAALRGKALGRRGRSEEEGEALPAGRDPVRMAAIIAGTLSLLVGIVLGMAIQSMDWGPSAADEAKETLESKLAFVEGTVGNGKWDVALTELRELQSLLETVNLPEESAEVSQLLSDVSELAGAAQLSDPYQRLDAIRRFTTHPDPQFRRGVVTLLRPLAVETDEVELLALMCKDPDAEVASIAQQGLIAVGGPLAIPYLHEAVRTSSSGSKLGDVALERALEIDAPEIVPVLITALDVRKDAPAPVLRAILEHLYQIGDPSCVEAARGLTTHDDSSVREAAEKIVADLAS